MLDTDAFRDWLLTEHRGGLAPATAASAVRRVHYLAEHGVNWTLFAHSPDEARLEGRRFLAALALRGRRHAGRNYVQALNWVAAYLATNDLRYRELHWPSPKAPRTQLKKYSAEEMERILAYRHPDGNAVVEKRRRALVWMAWATGLRRGEIGDLRLRDLDAVRGCVWVGKPRKDGKRRLLPLPDDAWSPKRPLQAWLAVRPQPSDGEDWLWTTEHGPAGARRMSGDSLYNDDLWFMRRDLGLANMDFRRFRHYRGKTLSRAGLPLNVIQEALGHANPNLSLIHI